MYAEVRGYGMSGDFFNFQIFLTSIMHLAFHRELDLYSLKVTHIISPNHMVMEEEQFWPCPVL